MLFTFDVRIHLIEDVFVVHDVFILEEQENIVRLSIEWVVIDLIRSLIIQAWVPVNFHISLTHALYS